MRRQNVDLSLFLLNESGVERPPPQFKHAPTSVDWYAAANGAATASLVSTLLNTEDPAMIDLG